MNQLKIEYIDLEQLKPFVDNPRNHSERNVDDILQSMKRFGWTNPIIARRDDNMVIAGHGRIEAARLNGTEQVPVIFTDFTENDAKLYSITDNRTSETSDWDLVALNDLVKELDEMPDIDLADSGFTTEELDDLLADVSMDLDKYADKDADAVPDVPETAQTQTGDIWHLGPHRVLCGDATKEDDVARLMDGNKADMVFTDPPYGVGYDGGHFHSGDVNIVRKREKLTGDEDAGIYSRALPVILPYVDGPLYLWFAGGQGYEIYTSVINNNCEIHALIIWHKINATYAAMNAQYKQRHEPCLYFKQKGHTLRWCGASDEATLWEIKRDPRNTLHPTQKPVELAFKAINNHDAGLVADFFVGSGSTLIASEKTGRQCYGMELDPHYCDVIARRYVDFVGTHADAWLERDGQRTHYSEMFDVLPVQIPTVDGSAAVSEAAL